MGPTIVTRLPNTMKNWGGDVGSVGFATEVWPSFTDVVHQFWWEQLWSIEMGTTPADSSSWQTHPQNLF